MQQSTIHVVGAGLAGLAAAVRLSKSGRAVVLYEAAGQAGGRCRSYHDATLNMTIDNGNHVLLSGNHAALDYLRTIGAEHRMQGPEQASFAFVDLESKERWVLQPNAGRIGWWVFSRNRRVPGTRALDYLGVLPLLWADATRTIGETMPCNGLLYDRLWQPFFNAALNTDPREASAALGAAIVRETLAAGGKACRPLIAPDGLDSAFVTPALKYLQDRNVPVRFGHRLRAMSMSDTRVVALDFSDTMLTLGEHDRVVLATPPWVSGTLVPRLKTPMEFRSIVNAHFRVAPPPGTPPMIGVVKGKTEWIFSFQDRMSVTISAGDRLLDVPRDTLARDIWREIVQATGASETLPPWQIIKERRATFAALPKEEANRPGPETQWRNLILAGDWTATGLPATIEGAIRSGNRAAKLIAERA
ncbi:MAG TPA: hydroxysqualene dehydroxylase HpnE [Xanthobacteraceae bacterium]|jgi:squalene-associated FAD-dependent desaturase|nr:hydroxysqualene dehydroxylase HpnE [Xanthobacteraceae bacterium]